METSSTGGCACLACEGSPGGLQLWEILLLLVPLLSPLWHCRSMLVPQSCHRADPPPEVPGGKLGRLQPVGSAVCRRAWGMNSCDPSVSLGRAALQRGCVGRQEQKLSQFSQERFLSAICCWKLFSVRCLCHLPCSVQLQVRSPDSPLWPGAVRSCPAGSCCEPARLRVERVLLSEGVREVEVVEGCHCSACPEECLRLPALKTFFPDSPWEVTVDVGKCSDLSYGAGMGTMQSSPHLRTVGMSSSVCPGPTPEPRAWSPSLWSAPQTLCVLGGEGFVFYTVRVRVFFTLRAQSVMKW